MTPAELERLLGREAPRVRAARNAWVADHGLEMRDIRTARPVAWLGHWLIMEDAGQDVVSARACSARTVGTDADPAVVRAAQ